MRFIYFVIASMRMLCGPFVMPSLPRVQSATTRIAEDIAAGELGNRALETRKQQAHDLRKKVLLYEKTCSTLAGPICIEPSTVHDQSAATASLLLAAPDPSLRQLGITSHRLILKTIF